MLAGGEREVAGVLCLVFGGARAKAQSVNLNKTRPLNVFFPYKSGAKS